MSARPLRRGNWSVQELERLRSLVVRRGVAATATLLRRSVDCVQKKALVLLRVPVRHGPWGLADDDLLRAAWGAVEPRLLAPMLGRSVAEVRRRAQDLRQKPRTGPWSRAELRQLKELFGTRADEDLEVCLQRSRDDIRTAAQRLCLAKDKRFASGSTRGARGAATGGRSTMPRWSPAEVDRLRQIYPDHENLVVAQRLGRSVTGVANKANQLGLKKSARLLGEIGKANIRMRYQPDSAAALDRADGAGD